jgi:hypothetical protein
MCSDGLRPQGSKTDIASRRAVLFAHGAMLKIPAPHEPAGPKDAEYDEEFQQDRRHLMTFAGPPTTTAGKSDRKHFA